MIIGVGTDILLIDRVRSTLGSEAHCDSITRRIFTADEIAQAKLRSAPLNYYATRFAGKEAAFKCLGVSGEGIQPNEIEILSDTNGCPKVLLHGKTAEIAKTRNIAKIELSLSCEKDCAIAFAVALSGSISQENTAEIISQDNATEIFRWVIPIS